jgi:hypothetical protein
MDFVDAQIAALTSAITSCLGTLSQEAVAEPARSAPALADVPAPPEPLPPFTFTRAVALLDTIPGITKRPPAESWWVQKLSADLTAD